MRSFWKAIDSVAEDLERNAAGCTNRECLNKLPKSLQAKAKRALQDIWMAETRKAAETALDAPIETYGIKYEKAVECLTKDRDALFAFYDFPPSTGNIYATNPIETVRDRSA